MFYVGTKIVVIGSNIKRKAGPRIGSIGFVILNNNMMHFIENGNFIICEASVLFTRYGFQRQNRFEIKRVFFIIPNIKKISIQKISKKILHKDINNIKKYLTTANLNTKPILLVSPANNLDNYSLKGKVFSCLLNNIIREKINCIVYGFSSKSFPNTERLQATLSKEAKTFLTTFLNRNDLNKNIALVNNTSVNILNEVLELIIKLDALNVVAERNSGVVKMNTNTDTQMFDALFKPFEFRTKILSWRRYVPLSIINYCLELRDFVCNEGDKLLQKHFKEN